jgi:hypothetical protein
MDAPLLRLALVFTTHLYRRPKNGRADKESIHDLSVACHWQIPTLYLEQTLANQITATLLFIFRTIRGGFGGINFKTRVNVASQSVYKIRKGFWTANFEYGALFVWELLDLMTKVRPAFRILPNWNSDTALSDLSRQSAMFEIISDSRYFKLRHFFVLLSYLIHRY